MNKQNYKEQKKILEEIKISRIKFTNVDHISRIELGMTLTQYCVADSIYNLSNSPTCITPGWCSVSKNYIANFLDITKRGVNKIIEELVKKGLLEIKNLNGKKTMVRVTKKWYENVVDRREAIKQKSKEAKEEIENICKRTRY